VGPGKEERLGGGSLRDEMAEERAEVVVEEEEEEEEEEKGMSKPGSLSCETAKSPRHRRLVCALHTLYTIADVCMRARESARATATASTTASAMATKTRGARIGGGGREDPTTRPTRSRLFISRAPSRPPR
jgi:hypothetical protein